MDRNYKLQADKKYIRYSINSNLNNFIILISLNLDLDYNILI